MQGKTPRILRQAIENRLTSNPAVAVLGPRQAGKTTLCREIATARGAVYLDLENPTDLAKLSDPAAYFAYHQDKLVCLDEIQRMPEIFAPLRSVIDERGRDGQFLVLGSASRDLLRQTSESLAGRIAYLELTPFLRSEVDERDDRRLWIRGGFPRSYLASREDHSYAWRQDFIRTYLERDIPALGTRIPSAAIGRLWRMCAHVHGGLLNSAKLASSLGVGGHTVRSHLDLLEGTFMVRLLPPDSPNLKKRLVKSPKVYLRDSGILHALLGIESYDELLGHPSRGPSFEGHVIENLIAASVHAEATFYRTSAGAELDLVLRRGGKTFAFECKASTSPKVTRGFWNAVEDIEPDAAFIVADVDESYPIADGVWVVPLSRAMQEVAAKMGPRVRV